MNLILIVALGAPPPAVPSEVWTREARSLDTDGETLADRLAQGGIRVRIVSPLITEVGRELKAVPAGHAIVALVSHKDEALDLLYESRPAAAFYYVLADTPAAEHLQLVAPRLPAWIEPAPESKPSSVRLRMTTGLFQSKPESAPDTHLQWALGIGVRWQAWRRAGLDAEIAWTEPMEEARLYDPAGDAALLVRWAWPWAVAVGDVRLGYVGQLAEADGDGQLDYISGPRVEAGLNTEHVGLFIRGQLLLYGLDRSEHVGLWGLGFEWHPPL